MVQFLCESSLQVVLAAVLALPMVLVAAPVLRGLAAIDLPLEVALWLFLGLVAIAILGAAYPAAVGRLFLVGAVVALPVGFMAAGRWLEGFAYRADIGPALFAAAVLVVLLVAGAAVSQQTWRASRVIPVDALRFE
jgi:putative ABC transport system permease protein